MAERKVELYMLAPENETLMQSFVLKTGNGRLIVVDGGMARTNENQDRDAPLKGFANKNEFSGNPHIFFVFSLKKFKKVLKCAKRYDII